MIDRETELLKRWEMELPMYQAWGRFVSRRIADDVAKKIEPVEIESFIKIPIAPRTKTKASLLAKAFHRNKPYANPYDDIEDKVGTRIAVLFGEDIRTVEEAVKECDQWVAEKSRDYEDEQSLRPYEFDYQSLHYVVRARAGIRFEGIEIAAGLPCEVQIRTLLQHAYSELTHDTIYKPSVAAEPDVKRAAAKSMALIEATGDYFTEVKKKLAKALEPSERVTATLERLYKHLIGNAGEPSALNTIMIDHYRKWAKNDFDDEIERFYEQKPWLVDRVKERSLHEHLYRQPGIFLLYWVISQARTMAPIESPLSHDELSLLYSDLGYASPGGAT